MAPTAETDDAPRNKYGRTKLAAERMRGGGGGGLDVVILRAPRFRGRHRAHIEPPGFKANELLGRRVALVDLVDAELRALACPCSAWPLLTICAPTLSTPSGQSRPSRRGATRVREKRPVAEAILLRGWRLADVITRVYDRARHGRTLVATARHIRFGAAGARRWGAEEEDEGARSGGESAETEIDDAVALEAVLQGAF